MSWLRVDDTLHAHRKVIKAGAEAMGLWVACGSFAASAASRQDGSLDADEVATRALLLGIRDWKKVAARLVASGLWDFDGDLYVFHNWDHYETSEGVNAAKAEKAAKKQKAYRDRKAASGNEPVTRYGNVTGNATGNEKVTPGNAPVTPGNALAGVTRALHAGACALPVPAQPGPTQPSAEKQSAQAPAALPVSDLAVEILTLAADHHRIAPLVDAAFASELALVAERGGKAKLVSQAFEEAAGELAAQGITDHGKARSLVVRFLRNVRPVAGVSGTGGGSGTYGAPKGRHGAPEPYNPFGPPTDDELRAAGVIQ